MPTFMCVFQKALEQELKQYRSHHSFKMLSSLLFFLFKQNSGGPSCGIHGPIKKKNEKMPSPKRTCTGLISRSRPGHKSSWISLFFYFFSFSCVVSLTFQKFSGGEKEKKFQIVVAQSRRVPFRPSFKLLGHTTQNKKTCFFVPPSNSEVESHS